MTFPECLPILRHVYVRLLQPDIHKHLRHSYVKTPPLIERSRGYLPDFAHSGCLNTTLSSSRHHHTFCIVRPVFGTPMAWHYSWHLIFFSLAVRCFFLHFPSDAISSSTYIRTRFSGSRRCVCSIVSWGFITTGRHSHGQVYARRLN